MLVDTMELKLPGINKKILEDIMEKVSTWSDTEKYCSIILDEVSLKPEHNNDKVRNFISSFLELGKKCNQSADHALTFMIRGAVVEWHQPIAFYFSKGITEARELEVILKQIVAAVVDIGLLPIALICSNVASFPSILHSLTEDKDTSPESDGVTLSGHHLSVIYDPLHLITEVRNHFLTKNISNDGKISKWDDILFVYDKLGSIRDTTLTKLTDRHLLPNNIDKMEVQLCTQLLSRSVAAVLCFTHSFSQRFDECRGGIISPTLKNTGDTVIFFDQLFDSCSGDIRKKPKDKGLRNAVSRHSPHHKFWRDAVNVLEQMRFVHKDSEEIDTESMKIFENWVVTVKSMQRLWRFFVSKQIMYVMQPRYFNSEPIANFFEQ